ncbi:hypothetical protein O6H91_06G007600 [Diphasiastrum complanatum]|uniref:Uncharacterized protein n=1 Tax=Diphasiastrum complanatum TaxID=34168 RepID=A0ACC2DAK9_DIPCM|nr:hypothetical protein O6H91_06G007600 [Diphasiastrum complanatum]
MLLCQGSHSLQNQIIGITPNKSSLFASLFCGKKEMAVRRSSESYSKLKAIDWEEAFALPNSSRQKASKQIQALSSLRRSTVPLNRQHNVSGHETSSDTDFPKQVENLQSDGMVDEEVDQHGVDDQVSVLPRYPKSRNRRSASTERLQSGTLKQENDGTTKEATNTDAEPIAALTSKRRKVTVRKKVDEFSDAAGRGASILQASVLQETSNSNLSSKAPRVEEYRRLDPSFFLCDALDLAPRLLGKFFRRDDVLLQITEVEAYRQNDTACHARVGVTPRTAAMFGPGGHAYVYLCYGMHVMLNVVADQVGVGAGVLIRACAPVAGMKTIQQRRKQNTDKPVLLTGPGKIGKALDLTTEWCNHPLYTAGGLELLDGPSPDGILAGPRVGIDYASPEDVAAPWRFAIAGSLWVSAPRNTLQLLQ